MNLFSYNNKVYLFLKKKVPLSVRRMPNLILYKFNSLVNYVLGRNLSDSQILNKYLYNRQTVMFGPFKGLKLSKKSYCSSLAPKIIGTYEDQIYLYLPFNNQYEHIYDIGCADGYYAVGLAMMNPKSKVFAYDISKEARMLCDVNARKNGVKNLELKSKFRIQDLKKSQGKKAFILCDIEGGEYDLFIKKRSKLGLDADWLIEVHEHIMSGLTSTLLNYFRKTHQIYVIYGRERNYSKYPELSFLSERGFNICVDENRTAKNMIWLYLERRL